MHLQQVPRLIAAAVAWLRNSANVQAVHGESFLPACPWAEPFAIKSAIIQTLEIEGGIDVPPGIFLVIDSIRKSGRERDRSRLRRSSLADRSSSPATSRVLIPIYA
jgi:hypothetical protein